MKTYIKNHPKQSIIIILSIILIFYLLLAYFLEPQKPDYTPPDVQKIKSFDNTAIDSAVFMNLLMKGYDSRVSWISRKEIAAWSATVLFLGILMILFQNTHKIKIDRFLLTIVILILLALFIVFVHQQFGVMYDGMAMQRAAKYWSYKTLINGEVPSDFSFNINKKREFPETLHETVEEMHTIIRLYTFEAKVFYVFPFWIFRKLHLKLGIIKNKDNEKIIGTTELEESILYLIIINTAFVYICYYWNYRKPVGGT